MPSISFLPVLPFIYSSYFSSHQLSQLWWSRSSTCNSAHQHSALKSWDKTSITVIKRNGLSTNQWRTPTGTAIYSLELPGDFGLRLFMITHNFDSSVNLIIAPSVCISYQRTLYRTWSKTLCRPKNARKVFFMCKFFSCSCVSTNTSSVDSVPSVKSSSICQ